MSKFLSFLSKTIQLMSMVFAAILRTCSLVVSIKAKAKIMLNIRITLRVFLLALFARSECIVIIPSLWVLVILSWCWRCLLLDNQSWAHLQVQKTLINQLHGSRARCWSNTAPHLHGNEPLKGQDIQIALFCLLLTKRKLFRIWAGRTLFCWFRTKNILIFSFQFEDKLHV